MRLPVLRRKRRPRREQALDTVASLAKAVAEWQLAKGAAKGAKKGAKAAGTGYVAAKATPWRSLGVLAAAGGAAAVAIKRLRGGDGSAEPWQAPSSPSATGATSTPSSAASPPSVSAVPAPSGGGLSDEPAPASGGATAGAASSPVTPLDVMTDQGGTVPTDPAVDVEGPNESGPGHNPDPEGSSAHPEPAVEATRGHQGATPPPAGDPSGGKATGPGREPEPAPDKRL